MIRNASAVADAFNAGRYELRPFYKSLPSTFSTAAYWYDFAVSGVFPKAFYYTVGDDYVFTLMPTTNHLFHYHGGNVSPYQKIVKSIFAKMVGNSSAFRGVLLLCDYLGYYPGISFETADTLTLNNSVTLPRYTSGKGVQAMMVQVIGTGNASSSSTITYTNQDGVSKTSQTFSGLASGTGTLQQVFTGSNPFIQLAAGDYGIRSVQSVNISTPGTGVCALVLLKPLCEITVNDPTGIAIQPGHEVDYLQDAQKMPLVQDGAYLNFLAFPSVSLASRVLMGHIEYIWG